MRHIVIHGSPGCGKTTKLKELTTEFISRGSRVCFLSHTRVAAKELFERMGATKNVYTSTIHSLAYNGIGCSSSQLVTKDKLQLFGHAIGVRISGDFDPFNEEERVIEDGDEAMSIVSRALAKGTDPMDEYALSSREVPRTLVEYVYRAYVNWKTANDYMDFNDILKAFVEDDAIIFDYDVLVVDEAQDLSPLQWAVIDKLVARVKYVIIAGDPDQALFCWGGADPEGMTKFAEKYDAEWRVLPQSYRIPAKVHAKAIDIRNRIKNKRDIMYSPRKEEGEVTFAQSLSALDFKEGTMVLYRTHAMRKEIEDELLNRGVRYTCLNGYKDPWESRIGTAIRAYRKAQKGEPLTAKEKSALKKYVRTSGTSLPWSVALDIPRKVLWYLQQTVDKEPVVQLSTIHGAKGKEADHVLLSTAISQRVLDGMMVDPDAEHRVFYVGVTRPKKSLTLYVGGDGEQYEIW